MLVVEGRSGPARRSYVRLIEWSQGVGSTSLNCFLAHTLGGIGMDVEVREVYTDARMSNASLIENITAVLVAFGMMNKVTSIAA
jgi:hypothetical protein